jgi:signal transduction histidine kinase
MASVGRSQENVVMMSGGRLKEVARCHPYTADVGLALVLLAVALLMQRDGGRASEQLTPAALVLEVLVFCALFLRSARPWLALALTTAGSVLVMSLDQGWSPVSIAPVIAVLTVAACVERRTATVMAVVVGSLLLIGASWRSGGWTDSKNLSMLGWTGFAAALGVAGRNHKAYVAAIEERARRAEHTREEEARRRVIEERMRIARELHDVVAHHIAVIHVQAGVVEHLITDQPEAAQEALMHVRRSSRTVLDELGGLLDVLRQADDPVTPTDPAPSLGRLVDLVDSFAASGLQVDWALSGTPQPLPSAVDLVAYRLVQEGLTNAHKHGTGSATLGVAFEESNVAIDIVNPSLGETLVGSGYGLVGMRERARAVGGTVLAAAQSDGTWRVSARLPLQAAT